MILQDAMNKIAIIIVLFIIIIGFASDGKAETGTVKLEDTNTWLNMRKEPDDTAKVVGQLQHGIEIEYLEVENNYKYLGIMSGKSVIGYVKSMYIQKPSKVKPSEKCKYRAIFDSNIYDNYGKTKTKISSVKKGDEIIATDYENGWVHLNDGGFIETERLEKIDQ